MTVHGKPGFLRVAVWVMAAAVVLLSGATAAAASTTETAALELPRQDFSEPVFDSLKAALRFYEEVRSELAADRLAGVPATSLRLAGALRLALIRGELAAPIPDVIEEAALAADAMGEAEDLAAARIAFGDVSRQLLVLAGSDPRLVEGWHLFACPMAEKFDRWIQPMMEMENPYMGPAMLKCGRQVDWSEPLPPVAEVRPSAEAAEVAPEPAGPQPEFKPGIPGLTMVDVRDHKFLWREIDELQTWERGERITVAEFRSKVIEKTAHFLELEGTAADAFVTAATEAVAGIRQAFAQERQVVGEITTDLDAAVSRVTSALQEQPRHRLFAPECKKWLLKLAFGPKEAKEARESRAARQSPRGSGQEAP